MELPVNVPTNRDWAFYWLHIVFLRQNLLTFLTEFLDLILSQRLAFEQLLELFVQGGYLRKAWM